MIRSISRLGTLIVICVMTNACSAGRVTIRPDELKTSHNILVIPYRASPIKVEANNTFAVGVAFGILGSFIQAGTTAEARAKTAEYLTKTGGSFNPSLVTAEECLNVLRNSSRASINSSSIGDLSEIPGADRLRQEDPRTFTETNSNWSWRWNSLWSDFRDTNSSFLEYKKNHAQITSDWTLELFDAASKFSDDTMYLSLTMKLSNSLTGQQIAVGWRSATPGYDIPKIPAGYDFKDFEQRFRSVSQKECTEVLSEMGLY